MKGKGKTLKYEGWILLSLSNFPFLFLSYFTPPVHFHLHPLPMFLLFFSPLNFGFFVSLFPQGIEKLSDKSLQACDHCMFLKACHHLHMYVHLRFACACTVHIHGWVPFACSWETDAYTHAEIWHGCVAFLYRDWNINQNWDYLQRRRKRGGSNHIPHAILKGSQCVFERDGVCVCSNVCKLEHFLLSPAKIRIEGGLRRERKDGKK